MAETTIKAAEDCRQSPASYSGFQLRAAVEQIFTCPMTAPTLSGLVNGCTQLKTGVFNA
jgi:hypothetical protein